MIRTRDLAAFSVALMFVLSGIAGTALVQSFKVNASGQTAAVGQVFFDEPVEISGASIVAREVSSSATNADRLKNKIAAGEGDISAGEPIFSSVDDVVTSSSSDMTDNTVPPSVQIGFTVYGEPLMSNDLWRFAGFSSFDQIGVGLDDVPIFGSRFDNVPLDRCGGIDEGVGYRYFLQPGKEIMFGCYGI